MVSIKSKIIEDYGNKRSLKRFGDYVVLAFESPYLTSRWQFFMDAGASYDFPEYQPHVTLMHDPINRIDVDSIDPYEGILIFGREIHSEIDLSFANRTDVSEFIPGSLYAQVRLLNSIQLNDWAKSHGLVDLNKPQDYHTTIVYSKKSLDRKIIPSTNKILNRYTG